MTLEGGTGATLDVVDGDAYDVLVQDGAKEPEAIEQLEEDSALEPETHKLTPEQEALVMQHLPLVETIARRTVGLNDLDDAIGYGSRALVIAAIKYDQGKVNPRATTSSKYFGKCILNGVSNGLREMYGIRQDRETPSLKSSVISGASDSLHSPLTDNDDGFSLEDIIPSSREVEEFDLNLLLMDLQEAITDVDPRNREIFLRRMLHDEHVDAIGEIFGLTKASVSRASEKVAKVAREALANYVS